MASYSVNEGARGTSEEVGSHSWDEYGEWHLGLTEGAMDETKGEVRVRLRVAPAAPRQHTGMTPHVVP